MDTTHFPALLIIIPLMAGPLCVMVRWSFLSWLVALLANVSAVTISIALFFEVSAEGPIRYALGGWAAPTGIEYYIDTLNASLSVIISAVSLCALLYALPSVQREVTKARHYLFYTGWCLCLTGLLGITITGDAFNVFVFLEISSLAMYMLIALGSERKQALIAAFRYLIMGSIGASFILVGIGFLYAATGTLNMIGLSEAIPHVQDSRSILVAFTFISLGLLIKAAVFPVHSWLPNAYQYAPTAVTAFLAGTATKVSLYVFLRFFFQIFGHELSFSQLVLGDILLPLAIVAFLLMSVVAIFQTDVRRILAYSSVAQIGYIVGAVGLYTPEGLSAGIVHIINHAFIKAALFLAVGCILYRLGTAKVSSLRGLIRMMPWTCSAFIIAGLGLIGVPLTSGFVSKWVLVSALLDVGWWPVVALVLVASVFAVIYIGKVVESFCAKPSEHTDDTIVVKEVPLMMLVPLWLLVIVTVYTGIDGSLVTGIADTAAHQLLDHFVLSEPVGASISDTASDSTVHAAGVGQ